LSSFSRRGEAIRLVRRGLSLGEGKWVNVVVLGVPALIGVFFLLLEVFDVVPGVDWLMFALVYPLMVAMLVALVPLAERMGVGGRGVPRGGSGMGLLRAGVLLVFAWGLWFLPLLLTGILDHMYVLLLVDLSVSVVVLSFFWRARPVAGLGQ
jgi:hypothetical protein